MLVELADDGSADSKAVADAKLEDCAHVLARVETLNNAIAAFKSAMILPRGKS